MAPPDERTPMVRPSRLALAPHARAGYRTSLGLALFILTLFFSMAIMVSLLNWETVCERPLRIALLTYGSLGLLFVLVILRHYCYFSELGSWPSRRTTTVCVALLLAIFGVGIWLIVETVLTRESCRVTSPILWRWCFALVLFFALVVALVLAVPCLRCFCGCVVAPIAYACVGCADAVQVTTRDLELPEVERPFFLPKADVFGADTAVAGSLLGSGAGVGPGGGPRKPRKAKDLLPAFCCGGGMGPLSITARKPEVCPGIPLKLRELIAGILELLLALFLCPVALPCGGCYFGIKHCCIPCFNAFKGCCGSITGLCCPTVDGPDLSAPTCCPVSCNPLDWIAFCSTCWVTCFPFCKDWLTFFRCLVEFSVGAGCLAPGRSLLALFVNTAALLWFFVFFLIEVSFNWGLSCDPLLGGPSPLHWLILVFAIVGIVMTLAYFLFEVFTPPPAPPRSALEAEAARVRRRGRILGYSICLLLFILFGFVLLYFVVTATWCPHAAPAVFRLAWLILLIWAALLLLLLLLLLFICCDCCVTGRLRLIVIFTDQSYSTQQDTVEELPMPGAASGAPGFYVGANPEDVARSHRDGDDFDRLSSWQSRPSYQATSYQASSSSYRQTTNTTARNLPAEVAPRNCAVAQPIGGGGGGYQYQYTSTTSYQGGAPPPPQCIDRGGASSRGDSLRC